MNKAIKLHFFKSKSGIQNFGDELSSLSVELVSERKVEYASVSECELMGLGSIFDGVIKKLWKRKLRLNWDPIHVWGTGFIQNQSVDKALIRKNFIVHGVRGELSHRIINDMKDVSCGDPGLLSKFLIAPQKKRIKTLIVPHIVHKDLPEVKQFINTFSHCKVADLTGDPIEVLKEIASSDIVISSSMHGLICADSFGIPNVRLNLFKGLKGGDFKFNDYDSSLGRKIEEVTLQHTPDDIFAAISKSDFTYQQNVDELCEGLYRSFPSHLK